MENKPISTTPAPRPLKLALIGYGKMGKAIEEIALQKGHSIALKITTETSAGLTLKNLQQCDVALEFTNPDMVVKNLILCADAGIPVVCGTTGWMAEWNEVKQYFLKQDGGLLYASNFSIGVNIFFELNRKLASLMAAEENYDVAVEEIHHTQKKDAPSGTAISIAEDIIKAVLAKKSWVNRQSLNKEDLTITSKRIDPAPGTHSVKYSSAIDDIEIIHTAHNRKGFAAGAVLAAEFIAGKKGIYSMKDVMGLS